jgi:hypothetical protein
MTFDMVFGFGIGLLVGMGSACGIMFAVHSVMMSLLRALVRDDEETKA